VVDASDLVSDDAVPIPCLHVPPSPLPSARALVALLADSDDDVPIPHITPRSALLSCDSDVEVLIPLYFLVPPLLLLPLFAAVLHRSG
jgi:hypothetical protein